MGNRLISLVAAALALPALAGGCATTTTKPPGIHQPAWYEKLGTSIKDGSTKMVAALTPKTTTKPATNDPPSGDGGPAVFVAVAQIHQRDGNFDEAEVQYQKALELDANYLPALVGYARLEDHRHNFEAATRLYQRAMKKHSREATVHNDLGLCYHRRGMLPEAAKALARAAELNPESKLYRNNLAAVYVDQGKYKEALRELTMAHGEAVAHYNLGYFLTQKKQPELAKIEFEKAVEKDPKLVPAQQWLARLAEPRVHDDALLAGGPVSTDSRAQMASTIDSVRPTTPATSQPASAPAIPAPPASTFRFVSSASVVEEPSVTIHATANPVGVQFSPGASNEPAPVTVVAQQNGDEPPTPQPPAAPPTVETSRRLPAVVNPIR